MTDSSNGAYVPGTYVKGDDERVAKNAKQAVALAFDGYKLKSESAQVEERAAEADSESQSEQPVSDAPKPSALARPQAPKETQKP